MGAGKTTVGRAVARRLDRPFFDSDHEIEARTGARIPVIFELEGEAGFRDREAQVIAELTGAIGPCDTELLYVVPFDLIETREVLAKRIAAIKGPVTGVRRLRLRDSPRE